VITTVVLFRLEIGVGDGKKDDVGRWSEGGPCRICFMAENTSRRVVGSNAEVGSSVQ